MDNVFWSGRVTSPDPSDPSITGIRALNQALADDERVTVAMVPIADGLSLARKR